MYLLCEACRGIAITAVNYNLQDANLTDKLVPVTEVTTVYVYYVVVPFIMQRQNDKVLRDNSSELQLSMIELITKIGMYIIFI